MEISRRAEHQGKEIGVFSAEDGVGTKCGGGEGGCGCGENESFCKGLVLVISVSKLVKT
jgi:hypothetical protein